MKKYLSLLVRFLASYGLAIVVLFWLLVLTFIGTWEQKDLGLFEVQRRYFNSIFVMHPFGPISAPLPGVFLLLILLTINLICGTVLRLRRRWGNLGLYIVHLGMLILIFGALITHYFAVEGQMTLAPGDRKNVFTSYHDWELVATERGSDHDNEYIIPLGDLARLENGKLHSIAAGKQALPLDVTITGFMRNAEPLPKGPMFDAPTPVINGFFARPKPVEKENERNLPAAYLEVGSKGASARERKQLLVWGGSELPCTFEQDGKPWLLELRRRAWQVPFTIELKEFRRELHPGTTMAKSYESDILRIEHDQATPVTIRMNEPLRQAGYTFFQASFAENPNVKGGFTSTFAVVRNPADQWPLYACIVITAGMLLHFGIKLNRHLRREQTTLSAAASTAAPGAASTSKQTHHPTNGKAKAVNAGTESRA